MANYSRRQFLAVSLMAAPSILGTSAWGISTQSVPSKRIGLIGCGRRGAELAKRLMALSPSVQICAICDAYEPHRKAVAQLTHAKVLPHWQDVINHGDIEAVVIATPDHWHAPMAIAAMQRGKDVYCETPMALNLADAKAFRDCAQHTGRLVQIGAMDFREGVWQTARTLLRQGAIGKLCWAQGGYTPQADSAVSSTLADDIMALDRDALGGMVSNSVTDAARFRNWRGYWDYSPGLALQQHYDDLAGLLYALDAPVPEQVSAAGGIYCTDGRETPDSFVVNAVYAGGHNLVLASGMTCTHPVPPVIRGTSGSITILHDAVELTSDRETRRIERLPMPDALKRWVEAIGTHQADPAAMALHYRTQVVGCMATEAYRTGKTVQCDASRYKAQTTTLHA